MEEANRQKSRPQRHQKRLQGLTCPAFAEPLDQGVMAKGMARGELQEGILFRPACWRPRPGRGGGWSRPRCGQSYHRRVVRCRRERRAQSMAHRRTGPGERRGERSPRGRAGKVRELGAPRFIQSSTEFPRFLSSLKGAGRNGPGHALPWTHDPRQIREAGSRMSEGHSRVAARGDVTSTEGNDESCSTRACSGGSGPCRENRELRKRRIPPSMHADAIVEVNGLDPR